MSPERAKLLFDFALSDAGAQSEFVALSIVSGVLASADKGNYGALIESACAYDEAGLLLCQTVLSGRIQGSPVVGVSAVQLIQQTSGDTEVKFMGGGEKAPFVYSAPLLTEVSAFGSKLEVRSAGSQGYNPMQAITMDSSLCTSSSTDAAKRG